MDTSRITEEITARFDEMNARFSARFPHLAELAENNPLRDLEKNLKALLAGAAGKCGLVSREEFEIQRESLNKALEKISGLEHRLATLEDERS
jgi:BMFP domain-containing protein YqiC